MEVNHIANLNKYWFYHGTTLSNAKSICKNGFKISKRVGSLGKGAYAFAESYNDAKYFAWLTFRQLQNKYKKSKTTFNNKLNRPCVLRFKLKHPELVLDFTRARNINNFNHFTNSSSTSNIINMANNKYNNQGKVKQLDGAIADIFLKYNNLIGKHFLGIYNPSQNEVSKHVIKNSVIPNSMELCIKNNNIIDFKSIKIYNPNKRRWI